MLTSTVKLWRHQAAAVDYMVERKRGILNAGMGTGKTLTSLAYIDKVQATKVLVIVKSKVSLEDVWKPSVDRFLVDWQYIDENDLTVAAQANGRILDMRTEYKPTIYFTTYARVWRPALLKQLFKIRWHVIIADESHNISAPNSATSKAVYKLARQTPMVWGLTGTLLFNTPMSVFGQARFVSDTLFDFPDAPGLMKAFYRFRDRYCYLRPINPKVSIVTGYKNLDEFNAELAKFVYRIRSEDVLDLPPTHHVTQYVTLPKSLMNAYQHYKKDAIIAATDDSLDRYVGQPVENVMSSKNIVAKVGRLRQLVGGTITTDDGATKWVHDTKLDALDELIEGLPDDEPAVIFAVYRAEIAAIKERLAKYGGVSELSGSVNELPQWKEGKTRIIVVQFATGAEAIDLTRAGYLFYYSLDYSLGKYEQSLARINRPGQVRKHLTYYYLLARGTIDEIIYKALSTKADVARAILETLTANG